MRGREPRSLVAPLSRARLGLLACHQIREDPPCTRTNTCSRSSDVSVRTGPSKTPVAPASAVICAAVAAVPEGTVYERCRVVRRSRTLRAMDDALLEQAAYYRARASEYDDW